ncbi:DUF1345 domain-containing protein [Nostocaceae cyanobacterium CENA357]|uniref:DUF1345 domain-containing protein n=1 Tax=Atlanticothrix silvestris CENA357 TaxID=1725252 RepID=A0A8J7L735_9CYAN|nr:DUF1345 domain-containing protein [Atlanticothrix silvestris CENA357]
MFLKLDFSKDGESNPQKIHRYAQHEYEGRWGIFTIIITTACVSVLAIGFLLNNKKGISSTLLTLHIILSVITAFGVDRQPHRAK